jgi:hypothetical protein
MFGTRNEARAGLLHLLRIRGAADGATARLGQRRARRPGPAASRPHDRMTEPSDHSPVLARFDSSYVGVRSAEESQINCLGSVGGAPTRRSLADAVLAISGSPARGVGRPVRAGPLIGGTRELAALQARASRVARTACVVYRPVQLLPAPSASSSQASQLPWSPSAEVGPPRASPPEFVYRSYSYCAVHGRRSRVLRSDWVRRHAFACAPVGEA